MGEKLRRWLYGRYGTDKLTKHLMILAIVLLIVSLFWGRKVLYPLSIAVMAYAYFRTFSKNIRKRYAEGMAYERFVGRIKRLPKEMSMRRTHHIYRCPKCRQKIRIPRGKGRIEVTCPKCRTSFIKRS